MGRRWESGYDGSFSVFRSPSATNLPPTGHFRQGPIPVLVLHKLQKEHAQRCDPRENQNKAIEKFLRDASHNHGADPQS